MQPSDLNQIFWGPLGSGSSFPDGEHSDRKLSVEPSDLPGNTGFSCSSTFLHRFLHFLHSLLWERRMLTIKFGEVIRRLLD